MQGSIALLRKPVGISSFAALYPLKSSLDTRKIGHTGTLDPFADGLLVVLCGYATRLATFFAGLDKRYLADIRFGVSTDTLDPEGISTITSARPEQSELEKAIHVHTGKIMQIPPQFSAIKVAGKRAYKEARKGNAIDLPPRSVTIHSCNLLSYSTPVARIAVHCSKGTYIRSLARDIAVSCGSVAYVSGLSRTEVGPFRLDEIPKSDSWRMLKPIEALRRFDSIQITYATLEIAKRMRQGKSLTYKDFTPSLGVDGTYAVATENDELISLIESNGGEVRYKMVVPE